MNELEPITKKPRIEADKLGCSNACDVAKRKQVDAHVQAFLKAVLDHAQNNSLQKDSKPANKKAKLKRDVSTQTDISDVSTEGSTYDPSFINSEAYDDGNMVQHVPQSVHVPNREMYSQETLNLFSLRNSYASNALEELFVHAPETTQYYCNQNESGHPEAGTSKLNRVSTSKIKQAIDQWAKNYQNWFFQSFGMDVRSVTCATNNLNNDIASNPSKLDSYVSAPNPVDSSVVTIQQPATIISHPPVKYIVPQGSLYLTGNQFSPYFSLVPSFYTPQAFSQTPQRWCDNTTQLVNSSSFTCPNSVNGFTSIPAPLNFPDLGSMHSLNLGNAVLNPQCLVPQSPVCSIPLVTSKETATVASTVPAGPLSFSDLPRDLQASLLATLALPILDGQSSQDQWGPGLRYGIYGRLPLPHESELVNAQKESYQINASQTPKELNSNTNLPQVNHEDPVVMTDSDKMPPPPPTFLLLRRQAMVCALQLSCRERGRELFLRERENKSCMNINYVSELGHVVDSTVGLQTVYSFTQLKDLPPRERSFFLGSSTNPNPSSKSDFISSLIVCDLLIGDVLIAQSISSSKSQSKICAARQAFRILSRPCFLVGSVRQWDHVEYLVLCLSPSAELVPKLPPFLCDPFESSDNEVNGNTDVEPIEVIPPKPIEDLWIYMSTLNIEAIDDEAYRPSILAQSAEFNHMSIIFELEVRTNDGQFECNALVDNQRCLSQEASNVVEAYNLASSELLNLLKKTQPIIGLQLSMEDSALNEPELPLWGIPEFVFVKTLMWGREELDMAIRLENLEAHCEIPPLSEPSSPKADDDQSAEETLNSSRNSRFASTRVLDHFLQSYAASALVTPLHLSSKTVPQDLWPHVRQSASRWGLLSRIEKPSLSQSNFLLVCKRVPLSRLKRSIYDYGQYGCFKLLSKGCLSSDALKRLSLSDTLMFESTASREEPAEQSIAERNQLSPRAYASPNLQPDDGYEDEPVTCLARRFIENSRKMSIKAEPDFFNSERHQNEDCILLTAELNQPSNAIEILDDLPKTLIPGIDF